MGGIGGQAQQEHAGIRRTSIGYIRNLLNDYRAKQERLTSPR
jgi:hypothetical protein